MAYELTWQFDTNRSYSPASAADLTQYQIWYLASFLLGYIGGATGATTLWTLEGSCDGTTGNMSGTWAWGTPGTYDNTKIVQITANPASSAHSWAVLKSPQMADGGYTYMLISAYQASTAGFSIHHSRTPWFLAGTNTFQPTSATRIPDGSNTGAMVSNDATTTARYFSGMIANTGAFIVLDAKSGSGFHWHGVMWQQTAGYQVGDTYPYYWWRGYNTSAPGWVNITNMGQTTNPNNTARSGVNGIVAANFLPSISFTVTGMANKDQITGSVWDLPVYVFWSDAFANCHARGRLKDVALTPNGMAAYGSTIKVAGVVSYIVCGALIIPFNAVPSL